MPQQVRHDIVSVEDSCIKRLRYRSWHRGCKETDLLLGRFADEGLESLDAAQLHSYERLLEETDADIWDWITGKADPAAPEYVPLLEKLKRAVDKSAYPP